jgi:hypothetical protein
MLNNESPARTVADSITKDENMQVTQHRSKLPVGGRLVSLENFVITIVKTSY